MKNRYGHPKEEVLDTVDDYSDVYEIEIIFDNAENLKEKFDSGEIGIYVLKDNNEYLMQENYKMFLSMYNGENLKV